MAAGKVLVTVDIADSTAEIEDSTYTILELHVQTAFDVEVPVQNANVVGKTVS